MYWSAVFVKFLYMSITHLQLRDQLYPVTGVSLYNKVSVPASGVLFPVTRPLSFIGNSMDNLSTTEIT